MHDPVRDGIGARKAIGEGGAELVGIDVRVRRIELAFGERLIVAVDKAQL